MNFRDFFRSVFDTRRKDWSEQTGLQDPDDEENTDMEFNIDSFNWNIEMNMQREIEEMFKNFPFRFFPDSHDPIEYKAPQSPRDEMLKDDKKGDSKPYFVEPKQPFNSPFGTPFGVPFHPRVPVPFEGKKEDTDLDGKLSVDDVTDLLNKPPTQPRKSFNSRSYSVVRSHGPDGRVEEKRTSRDQDGNEEVTVTRSFGNQSHSVTIKTDKSGHEEKIENFNNMDEGDLSKFNESWKTSPKVKEALPAIPDQLLKGDNSTINNSDNSRLFDKFFGSWFK